MCSSARYTTYEDLYIFSLDNKLQYELFQISNHTQGPNQINRGLNIPNYVLISIIGGHPKSSNIHA
jgi:hypothetical protein